MGISDLPSAANYLESESQSGFKREYVEGNIFEMDQRGFSNRHNLIASNSAAALGIRLWKTGYRAWNSSTKIRIRLPSGDRFYYPDVSVVRDPNRPEDPYHDRPVAIVEVISDSTQRIDRGEKLNAYQKIPSLTAYFLVEQSEPLAAVYRRGEREFGFEIYSGLEAEVPLPEIGISLPLRELYEGVTFGES